MELLIIGVLLFAVIHAIPAGATRLRGRLIAGLGENAYKGIFSLLLFIAIVSMVRGWKATEAVEAYAAPGWGWLPALVLMLAACMLFFAPYVPGNIRRVLGHPQLMAVALFGAGHLAASGDTRSLVLFGGLALWALIEMWLLNRRDGARDRPDAVPRKADFRLSVAGAVLFLVLMATHNWLFGEIPLPY